VYNILFRKSQREAALERPTRKGKDNIKMVVRNRVCLRTGFKWLSIGTNGGIL
jgi:hypothetical protein